MAASIKPRKTGASKGARSRLSVMQTMFVEELLADETFNASAAARKAGYKQPYAKAGVLLRQPVIRAILGKALQERITKCRLTAEAVLEHLRVALFLDPMDLFERLPNGAYEVRRLEDVPEEVRRCITKLKVVSRSIKSDKDTDKGTETRIEIELMSKDAAMSNALKHLGLVSPDNNQFNLNIGTVDLRGLLDKVEQGRNVIDGTVIEEQARLEGPVEQ